MATSDLAVAIANSKTHEYGPTSVFVARPSALGNPFKIGRDGDRQQCIDKYAAWLDEQMADSTSAAARKLVTLRKQLAKHGSLTLVCWCAPEHCHAEVIREHLLAVAP